MVFPLPIAYLGRYFTTSPIALLAATGKKIEIHELPFLCSAALLTEESEQFLLVTAQGVMLYDYSQQSHRQLCPRPEDEQTRPNEAAIAPDGSLWFSTMDVTARSPIGSWYRYEYDGAQPEKCLVTNMCPTPWLGWDHMSGL